MSKLILVSGPPGSGKTFLANFLSERLNTPYYSKDQIKEQLFDSLGWSDKEWSQKLGATAIKLMYKIVKTELEFGRDVIAEANFKLDIDHANIETIAAIKGVEIIELHCFADQEVLFQRFSERALRGERHTGHQDFNRLDVVFDPHIYGAIGVGKVVEVNTTNFSSVDYKNLLRIVKNF